MLRLPAKCSYAEGVIKQYVPAQKHIACTAVPLATTAHSQWYGRRAHSQSCQARAFYTAALLYMTMPKCTSLPARSAVCCGSCSSLYCTTACLTYMPSHGLKLLWRHCCCGANTLITLPPVVKASAPAAAAVHKRTRRPELLMPQAICPWVNMHGCSYMGHKIKMMICSVIYGCIPVLILKIGMLLPIQPCRPVPVVCSASCCLLLSGC